jgi:hypothetical protein
MRPPLLADHRINDGCGIARPVDEQFLAGEMRLAHRWRQLLAPVNLAEPRVAVAVWMLGQIFLPQQCHSSRHLADLGKTQAAEYVRRAQAAGIGRPIPQRHAAPP